RARPEIRPHLIAARMKRWLDIARCPIMNTKVPTWKARRNYRHLVQRYPEIAAALGYTEAMSYPSPLHDLKSAPKAPVSDKMSEAQEQLPAAAPTPACPSPATMTRRVLLPVLLDDEVV